MINLAVFTEHLFLRPRYHHYYFGDYYDPAISKADSMRRMPFNPAATATTRSIPINAGNIAGTGDGISRMADSYQYRRDNEDARPPRTWDAQRAISSTPEFKQNRMLVATPLDQWPNRKTVTCACKR